MRKLLTDIPFFVEAAKCSNFTQAANNLDVPLATLSRRISALEKLLGARLFYRTTRTVELTEDGREFLESCGFIMTEAETAMKRLTQNQTEPSGLIRLSIEPFVYQCFMYGALNSFIEKYPKIELHTLFSTEWKDLHREPIDLDIRSGPVPFSDLKVRKVLSIYPILYCSPQLLKNYPKPEKPKDLAHIPFIFQAPESRYKLSLHKGKKTEEVTIYPKHMVQSIRLALELTLGGHGATSFMPLIAEKYEQSGELIRLLPGWSMAEVEVHLVMPDSQIPKRIRLCIEHLIEHFRSLRGS